VSDPVSRPFYDEYAWAYDLIIPPPSEEQLDFVADAFARRGVSAGSRVLDAGCGLGRHASGLASVEDGLAVSFKVGDILELQGDARFEGLLCRGVLNDLLDGQSRERAFSSFAGAMRRGGAVVLDVREWETTARRKIREPVFEKTIETPRGSLTFQSVTRVDPGTRRLLVEERHTLRAGSVESVSAYDFQMRCWTREELEARMSRAGFGRVEFFGAYDRGTPFGATDRLVCVASRV
jgi:hypothetical protein